MQKLGGGNAESARADAFQIPLTRDPNWPSRAVWVDRSGPFAEAFRQLAVRVRSELNERGHSSVLITSALPQEGKTLTACNLALAFASMAGGEPIALVDLDLRVPGVRRALRIEPKVCVGEILAGNLSFRTGVTHTDAGVDIFAVKRPVPAAHQLLSRPELADFLKDLRSFYRYLIVDGPPALVVSDVEIIGPQLDASLAVVRAGRTPRSALSALLGVLPADKLLGLFLNDAKPPPHARRYYRSKYYHAAEAESLGS